MYGARGSRCGGWAGGSTPGDDGQTQTSPPSAQQLSGPVGLLATRTINLSPEACARDATDVGIFGIFCASRYRPLPLLISDKRSRAEPGGVDAVATELMLARPGGRGVARDAAPVARGSTTILDRGAAPLV